MNLKIVSFSNKVFSNKVSSISCNTLDQGIIEVLYNHKADEYFLSQGVILIKLANGQIKKFYSGIGYIKTDNNNVEICAFPIMSELDECMLKKLGDYGKTCQEAWDEV